MMKFAVLYLCCFFFACAFAGKSSAQTGRDFLEPGRFQVYLDSVCAKQKLPGIMVIYTENGQQYFYTSGYAIPADSIPFNTNTKFEAGSITKTFTAYILMSVLRDHKINDSAKIINFLPDSVQTNSKLYGISFLSLMNHTSGLPRLPLNMDLAASGMQPYAVYDSKLLFSYLRNAEPSPLGKYSYSNLGAALGGVLAEKISGIAYESLLDKYIWDPMKLSGSKHPSANTNKKSTGYFDKNTPAEYWNMNVMAPAGSLVCSANEMMRYLHCISMPISKKSGQIITKLLTPTADASGGIKIGRGWHLTEQKDKPTIYWHNGGTYGFSTFCAFKKSNNQSVLVVINQFNKNTISDMLGFKMIKSLPDNE